MSGAKCTYSSLRALVRDHSTFSRAQGLFCCTMYVTLGSVHRDALKLDTVTLHELLYLISQLADQTKTAGRLDTVWFRCCCATSSFLPILLSQNSTCITPPVCRHLSCIQFLHLHTELISSLRFNGSS